MFRTSMAHGLWDCCECSVSHPAGPRPWEDSSRSVFGVPPGRKMKAGGPRRKGETARAPLVLHRIQLWGLICWEAAGLFVDWPTSPHIQPEGGPVQGMLYMSSILLGLLCGGKENLLCLEVTPHLS